MTWDAEVVVGDTLVSGGAVPGGTRFRRHEHDGVHLCAVLGGGFVERRPGGAESVGTGTVRLSPSSRHDIDFARDGARCAVLELREPAFARRRITETQFLRDPWLATLVMRLDRALGVTAPERAVCVEEATVELLAQVARRHDGKPASPPPWLRAARELLHDEPDHVPTLGALAQRLGVHRVHLARAFRDHFGETVGDCARRVRVLRAARLLRQFDAPLSRVALEAGFADQSHMTRALRATLGATPAQLRTTLLRFKTAAGS